MKSLYEIKDADKRKQVFDRIYSSQSFRIKYFEYNVYDFGLYYFGYFFTAKSSPYHKQVAKDFLADMNLLLIAFREFGKSIWVLVDIIHAICYKRANFMLYFSFEKTLSEGRLFDVIVQLKTNQRIINDFGYLFPDTKDKEEQGLQKRSVSEFITTNNIKMKAMSMGTTARGMLYSSKQGAFRPDRLYMDDVDVLDSVRNPETINKNEEFLKNEVIGGVDSYCRIVFLGNIIAADGLVPRYRSEAKESKYWQTREIPVKIGDEIVWDRFVETDAEVEEWEKKGIKKISLEKKKEEQKDSYMPNFMLVPTLAIGNPVFNQEKILETNQLQYEIDNKFKDLRTYKQPSEDLYVGVDTAGGGAYGDYSTIVVINNKNELYATYQAKVSPDVLADVVIHLHNIGYKGLIVPESNSIGLATVDKLKTSIVKDNLHCEKSIDKVTQRANKKYGFTTTQKSKRLIISNLEEAIRKEEMVEFDDRTKQDLLNYYYDDKLAMNALKGAFDDLVIATALALFGTKQPKKVVFR